MHKDNEFSLDPNFSISTVSLGATRTRHFTRKNFNTEKLPLENGSLLIMNSIANKFWSHGIPAEPSEKDARISITFRKLMPVKRVSEENIPPAKRPCLELKSNISDFNLTNTSSLPEQKDFVPVSAGTLFQDDGLDMFFSNLSPSLLEEKPCESTSNSEYQCLDVPGTPISQVNDMNCGEAESVFKTNIGGNVFLSCELFFKRQLKIHIREYQANSKGILYPTKDGVAMDFTTWYDFYLKLSSFNFYYICASYIANNCVLVMNLKDFMRIQTLNSDNPSKFTSVKLNFLQVESLKETVHRLNDVVINYLFTNRLPHFIECERRLLPTLSSEEEDILMLNLIQCLENELSAVFKNVYHCNGCVIDHPSQRQHVCLSTSNLEKYQYLGEPVLLLLNMQAIASQFVNCVDFISENFLKNLSVDIIKSVLFKTQ